jgi:LacI family transcriptional regulator
VPATIYTVAAAAGVSPATVSRALNHPEMLRAATRERVYDAMRTVGFAPRADVDARRRLGVTTVGVMGPFSSHEAARRRLSGALRSARRLGYEALVQDHPTINRYVRSLDELPAAGRVDAVLVISLPPTAALVRQIRSRDVPVILLDQVHRDLPSIGTDDDTGGRLAAEHLLSRSMERFLIVRGDDHATSPAGIRSRSFARRVAEAGAATPDVITTPGDIALAAARTATSMASIPAPVGVFATDDERGAAALKAAANLGLRPGLDVRIVGYDDSVLARVLGMTTIRQPLEESGDLGIRMIASLLQGHPVPHVSSLRVGLIERSSS